KMRAYCKRWLASSSKNPNDDIDFPEDSAESGDEDSAESGDEDSAESDDEGTSDAN
ncbi:hypothetical protein A2U01_0104394, partial [Trifolium medium]|nr:hypothetical protein [Trifolium medium]